MVIEKVLVGVAVGDFDSARGWYGRLLGRAPDAEPMGGLAEWHPSEHGGIQLVEDAGRAGSSILTLVVDSLDERLAAYLEAEERLGRVREDADPEAAAALVLGACY